MALLIERPMPSECLDCPLFDCDEAFDFGFERPSDCPLVEVKEADNFDQAQSAYLSGKKIWVEESE